MRFVFPPEYTRLINHSEPQPTMTANLPTAFVLESPLMRDTVSARVSVPETPPFLRLPEQDGDETANETPIKGDDASASDETERDVAGSTAGESDEEVRG